MRLTILEIGYFADNDTWVETRKIAISPANPSLLIKHFQASCTQARIGPEKLDYLVRGSFDEICNQLNDDMKA